MSPLSALSLPAISPRRVGLAAPLRGAAGRAPAARRGAFDYIRQHTHTCYLGVEGGCGQCPSCVLRERGLHEYLTERDAALAKEQRHA